MVNTRTYRRVWMFAYIITYTLNIYARLSLEHVWYADTQFLWMLFPREHGTNVLTSRCLSIWLDRPRTVCSILQHFRFLHIICVILTSAI